jgi:hypothetical protein
MDENKTKLLNALENGKIAIAEALLDDTVVTSADEDAIAQACAKRLRKLEVDRIIDRLALTVFLVKLDKKLAPN